MKRGLLAILSIFAIQGLQAQIGEVIEQRTTVTETPVSTESSSQGEETRMDDYWNRKTGLAVDTVEVILDGTPISFSPSSTNELLWKEIGNWQPFDGDASVLGAYIAYASYKRNDDEDYFDINLYHASNSFMEEPNEILASAQFTGDEISTGPTEDSMTYIKFPKSEFTEVKNGFLLTVAIENTVTLGEVELDDVSVYTSKKGDGKGEHRAMVRITNESYLYEQFKKDYLTLDKIFPDGNGGFFQFDYDFMIIPVLDVRTGVGYVNMKGLKFNGHFPNPAREQFSIELDVNEPQDNFKVTVRSITGQTMKTINSGALGTGVQYINVDVADLSAGTYIYTVESDKSTFASQVIIKD